MDQLHSAPRNRILTVPVRNSMVAVDLVVELQQHKNNGEKGQRVSWQEKALFDADTAEEDEDDNGDNRTQPENGKEREKKATGESRGEREESRALLPIEQKMRAIVRVRKRKAKKCVENLKQLQQPSRHRKQHQQQRTSSSDEEGTPTTLKRGGDNQPLKSTTPLQSDPFSCLPLEVSKCSPSSVLSASVLLKNALHAKLSVSPASTCSHRRLDSPSSRSFQNDSSLSPSPSSDSALSTQLVSYPSSPSCSPMSSSAPHASVAAPALRPTFSLRMSCSSITSDPLQTCSPGQPLRDFLSPSRLSSVAPALPSAESPCADRGAWFSSPAFPTAPCSSLPLPRSACATASSSYPSASVAPALCLRSCFRDRQLSITAAARFFGAVCMWYAASLVLTALNKYLFDVLGLPLPVSITFLHFSFVSIALQILVYFFPHFLSFSLPLNQPAALSLLPAAACAATDVALTNSSYRLLSISAITLVKSSSVFFTYLLSVICRELKAQ